MKAYLFLFLTFTVLLCSRGAYVVTNTPQDEFAA